MDNIVIVGSSGHAKVVCDLVEQEGLYRILGFIDRFRSIGETTSGYKVLGKEEDLPTLVEKHNVKGGLVAIGDNYTRYKVVNEIRGVLPRFCFVKAIHPRANIGKFVTVGDGSVVMAGVSVNSSCTIGEFCIVNTNSSLDHDSTMGDFASLAPNVSTGGNAHIGRFTAIGIGATIIQGIHIGSNTVVGAGSLVLGDIASNRLAYGVPVKEIRYRDEGEPYL